MWLKILVECHYFFRYLINLTLLKMLVNWQNKEQTAKKSEEKRQLREKKER